MDSNSFLNIAQSLREDANYWTNVGSRISGSIKVNEEGNLKSSWDLRSSWTERRTSAEAIALFSKKLLDSTNRTLDDLTKFKELMDRVSYSQENQNFYEVALKALVRIQRGIAKSLNAIKTLQQNQDDISDSKKILAQQEKVLRQMIQPTISQIREDFVAKRGKSVEKFINDEFGIVPGEGAMVVDTEKLKKDVRTTILHDKKKAPLTTGSKIMVPQSFQSDINRNGRLTVNGKGYVRSPFAEETIDNNIYEEIYNEMVRSLGEKEALRIAPLLQQGIGGSLTEEMYFNIFKDRGPVARGGTYLDVNVDQQNVSITAQFLFYPQLSKEGKSLTEEELEPNEYVIAKKTITFPRKDLEANDFSQNPLPNLHVMDQFSSIIDRDKANEMLLSELSRYSNIDNEGYKEEVISLLKTSNAEAGPIAKGSDLQAPQAFSANLHELGELTINWESLISEKNPFRSIDKPLNDQEKIKIYRKISDLLGEEGAKRAASLIHQGIAATLFKEIKQRAEFMPEMDLPHYEGIAALLEDIQPRATDFVKEKPRNIPIPAGGIYVDLSVDEENLKITVKTLTVFYAPHEQGEDEGDEYSVGKKEIIIPLSELKAPDFNEKENPVPGLHVIQSSSVRISGSDEARVQELLRRF